MTYVVSDIHGRADRFHNILEQIHLSRSDRLFVLGDVIDRNPEGIQILQEIMDADNIMMLLGNHEYMMMNVVRPSEKNSIRLWDENIDLWFYNGGEVTYNTFQKLSAYDQKRIIEYIEKLPLNRDVRILGKKYLLIHGSPVASYSPDNPEYVDATMYAVWNRFDPFSENEYEDKVIICGHTPTSFFIPKTPPQVFINKNVICIDCGCAFPDGRLACLCLETGEVFYSTDHSSFNHHGRTFTASKRLLQRPFFWRRNQL